MRNLKSIYYLGIILLTSFGVYGQQNPAALNPYIDKRPLSGLWDEFNFSFWVGNNGTIPISATDSTNLMAFNFTLNKSKPSVNGGISTIGVDAVTGSVLEYFTITYNPTINTFTGVQKINKPLGQLEMVDFHVHAIVTTESNDYLKAEVGGSVDISPNPSSIGGQSESDDNISFYTYTIAILPIHIFKLKAINNGSFATLEWEATTDESASYFSIEKSIDGITFTPIAKIEAKNSNNTLTKYSTNDPNFTTTSFYRIVAHDKLGKTIFSNIEALSKIAKTGFNIFPNPAKEFVVVSGVNDKQIVQLCDLKGATIQEHKVAGNTKYIYLDSYASGTYFVRIIENGKILSSNKFIKY